MVENNHSIAYEIIRSERRRTVTLRVHEGKVQVLTPKHCPEGYVHDLLRTNARWIAKKITEQAAMLRYQPKQYVEDEHFLYLGEPYRLSVVRGKSVGVMIRGDQFFVFIKPSVTEEKKPLYIHKQLQSWYGERALAHLQQQTEHYAQKLKVNVGTISVRQFKSQWGNCSIRGDIQYNWRIILAPPRIINYLVVHELSHIRHHNHSARFWRLVESQVPDYKECRRWLNMHGELLRID